MLMENCAKAIAGIETSTPARRALLKKRILKFFIENRLSSAFVLGSASVDASAPESPDQLRVCGACYVTLCGKAH
jgi:hypothetical protein